MPHDAMREIDHTSLVAGEMVQRVQSTRQNVK